MGDDRRRQWATIFLPHKVGGDGLGTSTGVRKEGAQANSEFTQTAAVPAESVSTPIGANESAMRRRVAQKRSPQSDASNAVYHGCARSSIAMSIWSAGHIHSFQGSAHLNLEMITQIGGLRRQLKSRSRADRQRRCECANFLEIFTVRGERG